MYVGGGFLSYKYIHIGVFLSYKYVRRRFSIIQICSHNNVLIRGALLYISIIHTWKYMCIAHYSVKKEERKKR